MGRDFQSYYGSGEASWRRGQRPYPDALLRWAVALALPILPSTRNTVRSLRFGEVSMVDHRLSTAFSRNSRTDLFSMVKAQDRIA